MAAIQLRVSLIAAVLWLVLIIGCAPSGQTSGPAATATSTQSPKSSVAPAGGAGGVSFAGKTITLIVVSSAGGGTDLAARTYAVNLGNYLPGKPSVVVRNMVGAGGTIGANYAYAARPDGLTVLVGSSSSLLAQAFASGGVKFDLLKMTAILGAPAGLLYYVKAGIIDRPEDIVKARGLIFGHTSGGIGYLFVTVKELMELPVGKIILAYTGSGDARRAFLSGEINATAESPPGYKESLAGLVAKREVMLLFQSGLFDLKGNLVKAPGFPTDVLTASELYEKVYGKAPAGKAWEAYKGIMAVSRDYTKALFLPPGTPDNIRQVYWDACERMIGDPKFRDVAEPVVGAGTDWAAGPAFDKQFKERYAMDPEIAKWFTATLAKYGAVVTFD